LNELVACTTGNLFDKKVGILIATHVQKSGAFTYTLLAARKYLYRPHLEPGK